MLRGSHVEWKQMLPELRRDGKSLAGLPRESTGNVFQIRKLVYILVMCFVFYYQFTDLLLTLDVGYFFRYS